jgi:hypothetical protein
MKDYMLGTDEYLIRTQLIIKDYLERYGTPILHNLKNKGHPQTNATSENVEHVEVVSKIFKLHTMKLPRKRPIFNGKQFKKPLFNFISF